MNRPLTLGLLAAVALALAWPAASDDHRSKPASGAGAASVGGSTLRRGAAVGGPAPASSGSVGADHARKLAAPGVFGPAGGQASGASGAPPTRPNNGAPGS